MKEKKDEKWRMQNETLLLDVNTFSLFILTFYSALCISRFAIRCLDPVF